MATKTGLGGSDGEPSSEQSTMKYVRKENLLQNYFTGVGIAYFAVAVGAGVSQFFKGFRNSPNGNRLISGFRNARINAPITATSLAFWAGGVFPLFAVSVLHSRQKVDPWNIIIGATGTGVLYKCRHGIGPASKMGLKFALAGSIVDCWLFVSEKAIDCVDQQMSAGRKELVLQPMLAYSAEWFGSLLGGDASHKLKALLPPLYAQWLDSSSSLNQSATIGSPKDSGTEIMINASSVNLEEENLHFMYTKHFLCCIGLGCMMGTAGGYSYHFLKSFFNSPNGSHFISGIRGMHLNAPRAAASFGLWGGGILIAYEWAVRSLRQEDNLWKSTVASNIQEIVYGVNEKEESNILSITDTPESSDQP